MRPIVNHDRLKALLKRSTSAHRRGESRPLMTINGVEETQSCRGWRGCVWIRFLAPEGAKAFHHLMNGFILSFAANERQIRVSASETPLSMDDIDENPCKVNVPRTYERVFIAAPGTFQSAAMVNRSAARRARRAQWASW